MALMTMDRVQKFSLLAWQWNSLKHTSPRVARAISIAVLVLLIAPLI